MVRASRTAAIVHPWQHRSNNRIKLNNKIKRSNKIKPSNRIRAGVECKMGMAPGMEAGLRQAQAVAHLAEQVLRTESHKTNKNHSLQ
jgi:hypothetical protein